MTWKTLAAGLSLAIVGIACDVFEPVCGCTPAVARANVAGKITDASGAAVADVPFYVVGLFAEETFSPPQTAESWMPKTNGAGEFFYQVAASGEGNRELRVVVYPPGRVRVVVSAGTAPFSYLPVGTTTVAIVLPP